MRSLLNCLPVPLASAVIGLKRRVAPSPIYVQFRALCRKIGDPTKILHGPFAGMRYLSESHGSAFLPKIVGTYERELHETLLELLQEPFDRLVDVGVAEGYYAVGFAWRNPGLRVTGFDLSRRARHLSRKMARINGVGERVDIRPAGTPADIDAAVALGLKPLVICDCEGAEDDLLLPQQMPHLARATLVVELHEERRPGVSQRIRDRFEPTHQIRHIPARVPSISDLPKEYDRLTERERFELVAEGRPYLQAWFVIRPRTESPGT